MRKASFHYVLGGAILLALLVMLCASASFASGMDEVLLEEGDRGDEVMTMKQRLYDLGYFSSTNFSVKFNESTASALKEFQSVNGLPVTGIFTVRDSEALYAEDALPYIAPTATPAPTPEPLATMRPFNPSDEPERDEAGYLAEDGEYFYENDEEGQWAYLSPNLQIIINRYTDESIPLIWFETEMLLRGDEKLLTTENNPERPGTRFAYPFDIATQNQYVLGFTDDFYGHRLYRNQTGGIVIRNGQIISEKTYHKRLHNLPNLDMMAQFPDGSLKTYYAGSITAEELLALGAENVFCFGPVVVKDGVIDELVTEGYYDTKSPRQLLGMIEPNHYLLLTVQGRMADSIGSGLRKPAEILLARGVTEGFNLDGGNTMALVFRGRMLNNLAKWKDKTFVRTVTSLIGLGVSANAIPTDE
ncbi:MAG: phosphodiester glycosidase family protein [Eubacteriales bacterium]|nr:phosphodiester glycosidase family protein [Eubacteriales bacterium]